MKLTQKIQLERICRVEQLTRAEQAQLLACPEAQALLKENAALAGIEWHGGEAAPSRAVMLARTNALAGIPQEEPKMSLIFRWFAEKSLPYKIALAGSLALVIVLAAVFIPFERVTLLNPAWASSDGYKLTVPLEEEDAAVPGDPATKQAELENLLVNWRMGYERNIGPLPEGFAQSVDLSTADGAPEAVIALLNADDKQLESIKKFMEEQPDFPDLTTEPHTWFTDKDGSHPFTMGGIELSINGRTFTFPPDATKEEIERQIKAWLAEEDPQSEVTVDVEELENGKSVSVKVNSKNGQASASASCSSSSSSSSSSRSYHSSSSSGSSGGYATGGGGGGGKADGGGGGNAGGGGGGKAEGGGGGKAGGGSAEGSPGNSSGNSSGSSSSHHVEGGGSGSGSKSGSSSGSGSGSGSGSSNSSGDSSSSNSSDNSDSSSNESNSNSSHSGSSDSSNG
jgi:uncharacterized membrane protein YgcG